MRTIGRTDCNDVARLLPGIVLRRQAPPCRRRTRPTIACKRGSPRCSISRCRISAWSKALMLGYARSPWRGPVVSPLPPEVIEPEDGKLPAHRAGYRAPRRHSTSPRDHSLARQRRSARQRCPRARPPQAHPVPVLPSIARQCARCRARRQNAAETGRQGSGSLHRLFGRPPDPCPALGLAGAA